MYGNVTSQDSSSPSDQNDRAPRYLQHFFLVRLQHLVNIRQEKGSLPETGTSNLRLLDKAVYSTFCDCLDLGVGKEARAVLKHEEIDLRDEEAPEIDPN